MPTDAIQDLNSRFAIAGHVSFAADPGGLPVAVIHNGHASATIALRGGNVVAFQPHGAAPVLWDQVQRREPLICPDVRGDTELALAFRSVVGEHLEHELVSEVLSAIALVDIGNGDLTTAPLLPGRLRSADAIHLATALRLNARAMVVYDTELRAASRTAGIDASSPGAR